MVQTIFPIPDYEDVQPRKPCSAVPESLQRTRQRYAMLWRAARGVPRTGAKRS